MPTIGTTELAVIIGIAVLLFGAKRLPEAARGIGQSFNAFKEGMKGLISEDRTPPDDKHA
jgi:sec-independent protein translocase protein TatA